MKIPSFSPRFTLLACALAFSAVSGQAIAAAPEPLAAAPAQTGDPDFEPNVLVVDP